MKTCFRTFVGVSFIFLFFWGSALASDLSDGISRFTEENISADDSLGQADTNINFIVVKAMADAKRKQKKQDELEKGKSGKTAGKGDKNGDLNENSVIVGPGAKTGDITNVTIQEN
ncbi:MAG: hypothetical protein ACE5FU_11460 [Nitrospinota bacterium]